MDHSNFLHPAQVRLLLPLVGLLTFTTWFSHFHGIPLCQPRFHPRLGLRSTKQSPSSFIRYAYITFSFPLQHNYSSFITTELVLKPLCASTQVRPSGNDLIQTTNSWLFNGPFPLECVHIINGFHS
jgi:hypothetical protein